MFAESTLLGLFELTTSGWLTWYTKTDRYSRTKLNADLEKLRAYYVNRGYLEFAIESTQVTISPDKQTISIAISVREGQPYTVTSVKLDGDYLGKEDEFQRAACCMRPGRALPRRRGRRDHRALPATCSACTAMPSPASSRAPRSTARPARSRVVFAAEPQRRVYVRRIEVAGNTRTRDEVVRREFRQLEVGLVRRRADQAVAANASTGWATSRKSRSRPTRSPGSPDQVDLVVNVTEKPTGNLLIGAGYSNAEKFTFTASIKQDNVFGSGNYLGIELNTSKYNRTLVRQHRRPVLDGRRHLARDRRLLPHQPAVQQPGRLLRPEAPRARRSASACRSPNTTPCSSASASSAPRSARRPASR